MADRIVIMHEGHVSGTLDRSEFSQELIMKWRNCSRKKTQMKFRGNQMNANVKKDYQII